MKNAFVDNSENLDLKKNILPGDTATQVTLESEKDINVNFSKNLEAKTQMNKQHLSTDKTVWVDSCDGQQVKVLDTKAPKVNKCELDKFNALNAILKEVYDLINMGLNFHYINSHSEKEYRFFEEMLTQKLEARDGLELRASKILRRERKLIISLVNSCLSILVKEKIKVSICS